ncbi:hypothetical protein BIV25_10435 [Streptomyces sp. MUSC 14]|uniref:lanthionine synthetase LanC family protein n=1 Tax=Streptomyces sp. MUSC 14 TaxID=1354889 RepID=UPI0008F5E967|nr:lanthionine synthetase LanC family protein [Streptomyces sp. MUSC 14]OIJ99413.1 hypothetical protein BIV25_10435 [Streptomyces sp. MUSC 14]
MPSGPRPTAPAGHTGTALAAGTASRAVAVWARTAGQRPGHRGLYDGGLAGTLVGLRLGARLHPRLHVAADRLRDQLVRTARTRAWRREQVSFLDHDLITGPSGILLAPAPAGLEPFADHVAGLCAADELPRLCTAGHAGHPQLAWLDGRVDTGMGHGVAGGVAARTAAVRHLGPRPELNRALRRAACWLTRRSFVHARSVRTWDGAGLDGPPPAGARARQAWCYGTPGVSWALWDAADALPPLRRPAGRSTSWRCATVRRACRPWPTPSTTKHACPRRRS